MTAAPHGTVQRYTQGCRCADCKRAVQTAKARSKRERMAEGATRSGTLPHGTVNGYVNYNCRCERCTKAVADYRRARRTAEAAERATAEATS